MTFELRTEKARDIITVNAAGFVEYYSSRIKRLVKDNVQVTINQRNNGLDCAH